MMNLDRQERLLEAWPDNSRRVIRELRDGFAGETARIRVYPGLGAMDISSASSSAVGETVEIEEFIIRVEWVYRGHRRVGRFICEDVLVALI